MAKGEMAKETGEVQTDALADETTQLKKRARRRLIGAAALALLAAIILPMVMDHQPAPPLRDIQVRIPSPDEGATQKSAPKVEPKAATKVQSKAEAPKGEPKPEPKAEIKAEEAKPASQPDAQVKKVVENLPPESVPADKPVVEAWEVQLGAYQNPASVANLVGKLKQLGIPTYIEKIDTPAGQRTRVRAGPFPSQEAAEKARARIKIVGVDGPVAKKP